MSPQLREDKINQLAFFSNQKLYISSSKPCFFYVKFYAEGWLLRGFVRLLQFLRWSKSEKGHTPVNATINQRQFSDQITFRGLSWQILARLYETVGRLEPYQSMTFGSHAIVDGFASDSCMTITNYAWPALDYCKIVLFTECDLLWVSENLILVDNR